MPCTLVTVLGVTMRLSTFPGTDGLTVRCFTTKQGSVFATILTSYHLALVFV